MKYLLTILLFASLSSSAQNATVNQLNVNQINFSSKYPIFLYGLKDNFNDQDTTANNLGPNMKAVWNLFKKMKSDSTQMYKSTAIVGNGTAVSPLGVDFSKSIAMGTTAQRDSANYSDGTTFYATDTKRLTVKLAGTWNIIPTVAEK